jgi:hypothetical protein
VASNGADGARLRGQVTEGEKIRVGYVVAVVQNAIKIDPEFEAYLNKKKLTQKFWILWYAEYIVERTFPQPDLMEGQ